MTTLHDEIAKILHAPNFVTSMCQIYEGGNRQVVLQSEGRLPDELSPLNLCNALKLTPSQSVAFAYSLSQSQYQSVVAEAKSLMKSKLVEVTSFNDLSEGTVHAIVHFISTSEDDICSPDVTRKVLQVAASSTRIPASKQEDAASSEQGGDLARALRDIGYQCSASSDTFRKTLSEFGVSRLEERHVADILLLVVPRDGMKRDGDHTAESALLYALLQDSPVPTGDGGELQWWNLEVVVAVLSENARHMKWAAVVRHMDVSSALFPPSESEFVLLVKLFSRISGRPFPASGLMGAVWENRTAQLAFIVLACGTSRNLVDFSDMNPGAHRLESQEVPTPHNGSWMCVHVYSTLLAIAARGNSAEVVKILTDASTQYPEYVLIGLAQVSDQLSGVRTEILRRILRYFTGLAGSRPSSNMIMMKLRDINQDLLLLLCRIGLKNAQTVQEMLQIDQRLNGMGIVVKVQEECSIDEVLGYWCLLADRGHLSLEDRLLAVLAKNPQLARNVAMFAKSHADALRPRSALEGPVLSVESFSTLLKCIQQHPAVVSPQEVRAMSELASQQQQTGDSRATVRGGVDGRPGQRTGGPESAEIEEVSNSYFQKIYTSDMTIDEVIHLLKRFKSSTETREQEIFRCMIHNLFDEYRFFHKYPEKELQVTGRLFGTLIQHQLVSSITLGIALRYVLEALRKDPEQGGSNEKMFRFGKISLEQFRSRLSEWPQYCSHLVQIPHLTKHCQELFKEAQRAISNPSSSSASQQGVSGGASQEASSLSAAPTGSTSETSMDQQPAHDVAVTQVTTQVATMNLSEKGPNHSTQVGLVQPRGAPSNTTSNSSAENVTADGSTERRRKSVEKMYAINMEAIDVQVPSESTRDQILFIVNNIAKSNVEAKTNELRSIMEPIHYNWFANYLIVKRVSTQPNLHDTYLAVIDLLDSPALVKAVLNSSYHNITKLLQSSKITTSSSERSLLRNLGIWLGQLTLARNKPLLQKRCDLKELLLWGYENGRLIAVCSFVAKIVEGCNESKIFHPPNPWLMAVLGVMRELFEIEGLKMNIKFEVQVLCKKIGVRIDDIPQSNLLALCPVPVKEKNPDFNVRSSNAQSASPAPMSQSSPPSQTQPSASQHSASPLPPTHEDHEKVSSSPAPPQPPPSEHTVIPNLGSHVIINPSLHIFQSNPGLRRIVPLAVDRAIREIIQPVVERSVTIACVTTQQLIQKDFALEPNENQLRRAAHLMISNLAGSLALVTCKEPLRVSIGNHLRTLLSQSSVDQMSTEQVVQVCSTENLELGCMLIEKAATEKAIRDIDEALAPAIQLRRKHNETGVPLPDTSGSSSKSSRFPRDLPDAMKPIAGGLTQAQMLVYEAFQRQRLSLTGASQQNHAPQQSGPDIPTHGQPGRPSPHMSPSMPPSVPNQGGSSLSMAQALEAYQIALSRVDIALKNVMMQVQGRDVYLSMLGGDHEIFARLRDVIHITQCTQPGVRIESALTFAESVFKRLVDTVAVNDTLRLEVMVGILEALRDACGGQRKFTPDMISWLSHYATFSVTEESSRKLHRDILTLLMRAKLLRAQEVDLYFANNLDGGQNMIWVEVALNFIRHSLAEGIAATFEFSKVFEIVSKMRPANTTIRKQLQKWLTDIRTLAAAREDPKSSTGSSAAPAPPSRDSVREHVMLLLDRWLRVWNSSNDQVFGQYLQLLHQYGVLKTEEAADRFFRLSAEVCVEACVKSGQQNQSSQGDSSAGQLSSNLSFTVIDALSKLFLLLVRLADKETSDANVRLSLLSRILNAIARALLDDHEARRAANTVFDQRPYYRLFSNLMQDLGVADTKQDPNPALLPLLVTYSQVFLALQPSAVPTFAFAWLQLISHRSFMPHLLHARGQKGWPYMHRLLLSLLHFMQPFLRSAILIDPLRRLYKGTLKVLLVLLHDFPEFLCDYHLSLCEPIPQPCVQLRNLVLSAFPRSMRLPDPFTPNLKVDLLPEIAQSPRLLTDFVGILHERGLRSRLDSYLANKQPAEFLDQLVPAITQSGGGLHSILTTAVVMYVASYAVAQQQQQKTQMHPSVAMDVFKHLVTAVDAESRYTVLNVMANQLRYPNNHTHYFSCVLLSLFGEASNEFIQEQITRVLLERLIVHRPHPWGLLITFIELIKNPRYAFWRRPFTRCAPEIERVFESVARSCIGPTQQSSTAQGAGTGSGTQTSDSPLNLPLDKTSGSLIR
eukprot:CAMPEP_0185024952 /NCGR_PEP_ID=MMETSP1103-20130426/8098_1 /TAXON_ID=36769 /ORGANISM="Paraphysomonas bandaiensis, Strain Caron Lab Isolate" /LENGTH=2202 /DNA_ID=CAMNT_0027558051 /DNA_START=281 /DNA_END=6889 /DNA_ORIENTATION=-